MENNTQLQKISDNTLFPLIKPLQQDIIRFIGEDNMKREMSFAIQAANANSYLATATPQSVVKAIYNLAITGLSLNPVMKLAYLIPKKIDGAVQAVLMPSYQGLVSLIVTGGGAQTCYAHVVYQGDLFKVNYGTEPDVTHEPKSSGNGKEILAVYGVAVLPNGRKQVEVMYKDEIDEIREYSDSYQAYKAGKVKSCIWTEWPAEMARKTVIKRMWKYIPKSKTPEFEKAAAAIDLDNQEYMATTEQINMIEGLLNISAVTPEQRRKIENEMADYTFHRASSCIAWLQENRLDPITSGQNYGAGEIAERVANKMDNEKE